MIKKILVTGVAFLIIFFISISTISTIVHLNNILQPKIIYKGYKIYDLAEQINLDCKKVPELLDADNKYLYFFGCAKSDNIFFVDDRSAITVKDAYSAGIVSTGELYKLGLVERKSR